MNIDETLDAFEKEFNENVITRDTKKLIAKATVDFHDKLHKFKISSEYTNNATEEHKERFIQLAKRMMTEGFGITD